MHQILKGMFLLNSVMHNRLFQQFGLTIYVQALNYPIIFLCKLAYNRVEILFFSNNVSNMFQGLILVFIDITIFTYKNISNIY